MAKKSFALNNATSLNQQVWCWDDDVDFQDGVAHALNLSDTITFSDSIVKSPGKVLSDTITFSDALSRVWNATLSLADTITFSDAISKGIGSVQADVITFSDAIAKTVGKAVADTITFSDAIVKGIGVALADTLTFSDAISKAIGKRFAEVFTFSDAISLAFSSMKKIPKVLSTTAARLFGISREAKPSGMTHRRDDIDVV